ncbi:MAG: DUF6788 family protein, partial [Planctomycetota bacterium]
MPTTLQDLDRRKRGILLGGESLGDLRAGSITENYRRCGKSACRCARLDDPGHGP